MMILLFLLLDLDVPLWTLCEHTKREEELCRWLKLSLCSYDSTFSLGIELEWKMHYAFFCASDKSCTNIHVTFIELFKTLILSVLSLFIFSIMF